MVLDHRGDDDVVSVEPEPVSQMVQGLCGVAAEYGDVVPARTTGEPEHGVASVFVRGGGDLRLEARAPVDARVPGQELLDAAEHRRKCGRRRGSVERDVLTFGPVGTGNADVLAHERDERT